MTPVIEEKVNLVKKSDKKYSKYGVIKILVTHFAKKILLDEAERRGIIVVQSFEW
jgi:hypothetical protein